MLQRLVQFLTDKRPTPRVRFYPDRIDQVLSLSDEDELLLLDPPAEAETADEPQEGDILRLPSL
jgi:hypothetical protein